MATRGTVPDTLTIGVVEDDPSFLRALRRLLSGAGFSVATFASAEEFLASDSAAGTACLVLDVHLGGMSGFDLQQQLATAGRWIPTIFITAHDDSVTRERARSGVAYLRKPFREEALVAAIRKALDSRGA
jgi:FixJ family two-component response regulator